MNADDGTQSFAPRRGKSREYGYADVDAENVCFRGKADILDPSALEGDAAFISSQWDPMLAACGPSLLPWLFSFCRWSCSRFLPTLLARSIFSCRPETIHMTWRPRRTARSGTLVSAPAWSVASSPRRVASNIFRLEKARRPMA